MKSSNSSGYLYVWPLGDLERVFPMDKPVRNAANRTWRLYGARGEHIGFQLGIHTDTSLDEITVTASDLRSSRHTIPAGRFTINWVGLIPVPSDAFETVSAERPDYVPGWYPDPLLEEPPWRNPVPARSASVYLSLFIGRRTVPGLYRGTVHVRVKGKIRKSLPVSVNVWPFAIPAKPTFHLTNWLHLDCITKYHRCRSWSSRHWKLIDMYARKLADYRHDVISTPTLFGNFHNSDPMVLVDTYRKKDGSYRFDFKRLGKWVELFDRHGFRLFEMWHMASQADGKYAPPFFITDEKSGRRIRYEKLSTRGQVYRKLTSSFLHAISAWLDRRGLLNRFLLHVYDEPVLKSWPHHAELSAFFHKHAPGIRHLDAISTSGLITDAGSKIDIPVPLTKHLSDDEYFRKRAAEGKEPLWWYTACGPFERYANRFISMPLSAVRILHWQAFVYGISGYLHWGYNFWHKTGQEISGWPGIGRYADHILVNPYREHPPNWAPGDACIVYPHPAWWEDHPPLGSLRYEAVRQGMQDYEMLVMLDRLVRTDKARKGTSRAGAIEKGKRILATVRGPIAGSLTEFTRDPGVLYSARRTIGECLAELSS